RQVDGAVAIAGEPDHPANFGALCSKGSALAETLSMDGRLLHPMVDGRRAGWDEALDRVALAFAGTAAAHGPDSVALYVSGQILIEDYYVANKLMKGFLGTANIDTNSRLCMASSVAGHRRAFGADTVPGVYADLEEADLVVLVGSNLAWCHPVLHRRLVAAREKLGTRIVVVDPRRTATAEDSDLHLALAPGSDVALFAGLLAHLARAGAVDPDWVGAHANGFDEALRVAAAYDPARVAALTGLAARDIEAFYAAFAATERVVTVYSQGVNQSTSGTDKVNAIVNCHLATARIGRPGMGPFSVTGQPNAMGGREVGGLANMLAAHLDIDDEGHRELARGFWRAPTIAAKPGLKAVDLFHAVREGRVRALWIMGTNPAVSMPDAEGVREALRACPFVCVSDVEAATDTGEFAHVLLPSLAWGEKDGTVTNSERRISRQRAFLAPPGEARADWAQLAEVGRLMGFGDAFAYPDAAAVFREYAAMTALKTERERDLDLSGVADLSDAAYAALAPFQWPRRRGEPAGETRFFADGRFFHPDGKARFVPTAHRPPAAATDAARPLMLNTGRVRDQWHTMTRTGKAARLMTQAGEPFLEIHPDDAAARGLSAADLAEVESAHGRAILRVSPTRRVARGEAFAPMHWTDRFAPTGRVGALIAPATDPVSGQPELKATPVEARRFPAAWFAFALCRARPSPQAADYVALAPSRGGFRIELASRDALDDPERFTAGVLGLGEGV
ncbi:MAG: nitrate reductase, partial [Hyphomicrobiales bacterium]|nr:nitrate reductase [Hyphomicrobiales bacterium]